MTVAIAEPDGIAMAKHDVVCARAAGYRLVKVVAHRIVVGQVLEVGSVTLLNVVEAHRSGPFARCFCGGRIFNIEI